MHTVEPRPALVDSLLPVLAGVLLVSFSPLLYHQFFAPRAVALLIVIGPGLVDIVSRLRQDRSAAAATAFLAVAAAATLASPAPVRAMLGAPGAGTGLLFLAACVAVWSLGRTLSPSGQRRVRFTVLSCLMVNVVVATLQHTGSIPIPTLRMTDRPFGLTGNPVHLTALAAAGIPLVGLRRHDIVGWALGLLVVAILAFGVQVSGGRLGLVLLVIAGFALTRGHPRTAQLAAVCALLVGVALGSVIPGGSASATERAAAGAGGGSLTPRIETWKGAVPAVAARPLLGYGPGRVGEALSPRRTAALARSEGPDRLFRDAHNFLVEHLVTVGVAGAVLLCLWLALAARGAAGDWGWCALILGVAQLVEPMSVVSTPVALLALGVARPAGAWRSSTRVPRFAAAALAVGGLAGGITYLAAEAALHEGSLDFDRSSLERADSLLPEAWPTVPLVATRVEGFYGASDLDARQSALAHAREAVHRDPYDPGTWVRLGNLEAVWGSKSRARAAFDESLERDPWSAAALRPAAALAEASGESSLAARYCRRLKAVDRRGGCAGRSLDEW